MQKKFIVIEGIDGSGKETQAKLLVQKIKNNGGQVEYIDFPQYNNFFGSMVRQYLNGKFGKPTEINPQLASVLYSADRWESAETIKKWLTENKIVIADRYYTSNLIHQGAKLTEAELDDFVNWIEKMELEIFKIPKPDIIIYLHLPAEKSFHLIAKRGNGYDGHDKLKHLKTAESCCLYLTKKLGWINIECCKNDKILSIEDISAKIWQTLQNQI